MTHARFFHQLAALLESGIPSAQCLPLAAQTETPSFQAAIRRAASQVDVGRSLVAALRQARVPLSGWELQLLEVGETGGLLAEICRRLGDLTEVYQRRSRLYGSLVVCLVVFGIGLGLGLLALALGGGIVAHPSIGVMALVLLGVLIGKDQLGLGLRLGSIGQRLGRNLPGIKSLTTARSLTVFAELALPLRCGLSVAEGIRLIAPRIPDPVFAQHLRRAGQQVRQGNALSECLQAHLPPPALQFLRTGEETGELDTMLDKLGDYYEQDLERRLRQLVGIVQPLTIVMMGGMVLVAGIGLLRSLLATLPQ